MEYPNRKHTRLKNYDYSRKGAYFVTVCTAGRKNLLSEISYPVGRGLAPAEIHLTACGQIIKEELEALPMRFPTVRLEKYVIMPNHIHLLLMLRDETAGASPHPTLMQIMGVFKSLTTRKQDMKTGRQGEKLWQTSYHEHIVRDENDFLFHWTYIDQNPARWGGDEYFGGTP